MQLPTFIVPSHLLPLSAADAEMEATLEESLERDFLDEPSMTEQQWDKIREMQMREYCP